MGKRIHPTRRRLVETVVDLLETEPLETLTVELVLSVSGVSKGSLYHHFDDFSDLIETALVGMFVKSVDENAEAIREIVENATNFSDLLSGLNRITQDTQSEAQRAVRFRRARLLSLAEGRPRLMARMAEEQARLTRAYAELFGLCQQRGWFRSDFSPHAASVFIQAYTLGKIVDDVTPNKMDPGDWDSLIMKIVAKVFAAEPASLA